jgi:hypothetical protein
VPGVDPAPKRKRSSNGKEAENNPAFGVAPTPKRQRLLKPEEVEGNSAPVHTPEVVDNALTDRRSVVFATVGEVRLPTKPDTPKSDGKAKSLLLYATY